MNAVNTVSKPGMRESTHEPLRVLLADDQADVLVALRLLLKAEGFETEAIDRPGDIIDAVANQKFNLILMDMNYTRDTTSGREGLDVLRRLGTIPNVPPIVVMTAWGSISLAVEAMQRGARDFIPKPWDNDHVLATVRKYATPASEPATRTEEQEAADKHARDMKIARKVQSQLFPHKMPDLRTLEYAGHCRPAGVIGGDYYDFMDLAPGRMALVLADVSGKGVSAALMMANLQATLRSHSERALEDLSSLVTEANRLFFDATSSEHYATLFLGEYNDRTRCLSYINCGHVSPLVLRKNGQLDHLHSTATVLGMFSDLTSEVGHVELGGEDTFLVFSDGVTEAENDEAQPFGEARLVSLVRQYSHLDVAALPGSITEALVNSAFPPDDDVTVIAARGR